MCIVLKLHELEIQAGIELGQAQHRSGLPLLIFWVKNIGFEVGVEVKARLKISVIT